MPILALQVPTYVQRLLPCDAMFLAGCHLQRTPLQHIHIHIHTHIEIFCKIPGFSLEIHREPDMDFFIRVILQDSVNLTGIWVPSARPRSSRTVQIKRWTTPAYAIIHTLNLCGHTHWRRPLQRGDPLKSKISQDRRRAVGNPHNCHCHICVEGAVASSSLATSWTRGAMVYTLSLVHAEMARPRAAESLPCATYVFDIT
ncbi:hypothetical protein B0H21DRAFT_387063 [Amylocystis lapponica]|nr:hypothetical protein B0H21DRAFT_387063 [Amylocystis lapponica]